MLSNHKEPEYEVLIPSDEHEGTPFVQSRVHNTPSPTQTVQRSKMRFEMDYFLRFSVKYAVVVALKGQNFYR